ncbi:hypothetical protein ACHAWO_000742 [Cyclotella atomus]|uniref:Phospholipid scramblase n=1 Tax=Cyclotella atomus TaxID=382360 RepID=A0ABD3PIQ2_9STRA
MVSANITTGSKPYIVEDRPMISRSSGDRVKITHTIEPGKEETGCLTCFYSPEKYPILSKCPCFDYPEYVVNEVRASQYIYIRENSLEYNQPIITPSKSTNTLTTLFCCGHSPSDLTVRDSISVIYYDDILFDTVRNDTPKCHECSTFCCGGKGEVVRLESTYCGDLCYRGRGGCSTCCLVPVCCPECICPCGVRVSFVPLYIAFAQFRRH